MVSRDWAQIGLYLVVLLACVKPLGSHMAKVLEGERTFLTPVLGWLERLVYKLGGVDPHEETGWQQYASEVVIFGFLGVFAVYLLQRVQGSLPLNPALLPGVSPDSAFNTAVSFATNTNWQSYSGETTMSYITQMLGLTVQNFISAGTGIAVLAALIRGLRRRQADTIGSFWADLTRVVVYILIPLSTVLGVALASQGVVQTLAQYVTVTPVQTTMEPDGHAAANQTIALGPVASQIAIKQLGTNGGGFFGANSAHPFENPTPLTNFLSCLSILLISAGLCYSFGVMMGARRQGWALLAAMVVLFVLFLVPAVHFEERGNPWFASLGLSTSANWEGKEARIGIGNSALWAVATTAASNGSVNSMHDSYTPLGGLFPMVLMQLGEVVFGGVGSGLYGMLCFAIVAVFIAGLMVGRTPEYLGKKVEAYEMKLASLVILIPCALVLLATATSLVAPSPAAGVSQGVAGMANPGAHGFSELLYAYSSMGNNNGSAFAGYGSNTPFHNFIGGAVMWVSRYWLIVPVLAIAGSMARKKVVAMGPGTLPTHTPLFVALLCAIVLTVGALTFVPALALGPIVEHLELVR